MAKITSIKIEYADGGTKDLTLEQARQLYAGLSELFAGNQYCLYRSLPVVEASSPIEPYKYAPTYPQSLPRQH